MSEFELKERERAKISMIPDDKNTGTSVSEDAQNSGAQPQPPPQSTAPQPPTSSASPSLSPSPAFSSGSGAYSAQPGGSAGLASGGPPPPYSGKPPGRGPAKIAHRVARHFTDPVRSRGQSYKDRGKVKIVSSSPELTRARVEGTESYVVRVRMFENRVFISCSCPYFHPKGTPCKHVWATLLCIDEQKLMIMPPVRMVRLVSEVGGQFFEHAFPPPAHLSRPGYYGHAYGGGGYGAPYGGAPEAGGPTRGRWEANRFDPRARGRFQPQQPQPPYPDDPRRFRSPAEPGQPGQPGADPAAQGAPEGAAAEGPQDPNGYGRTGYGYGGYGYGPGPRPEQGWRQPPDSSYPPRYRSPQQPGPYNQQYRQPPRPYPGPRRDPNAPAEGQETPPGAPPPRYESGPRPGYPSRRDPTAGAGAPPQTPIQGGTEPQGIPPRPRPSYGPGQPYSPSPRPYSQDPRPRPGAPGPAGGDPPYVRPRPYPNAQGPVSRSSAYGAGAERGDQPPRSGILARSSYGQGGGLPVPGSGAGPVTRPGLKGDPNAPTGPGAGAPPSAPASTPTPGSGAAPASSGGERDRDDASGPVSYYPHRSEPGSGGPSSGGHNPPPRSYGRSLTQSQPSYSHPQAYDNPNPQGPVQGPGPGPGAVPAPGPGQAQGPPPIQGPPIQGPAPAQGPGPSLNPNLNPGPRPAPHPGGYAHYPAYPPGSGYGPPNVRGYGGYPGSGPRGYGGPGPGPGPGYEPAMGYGPPPMMEGRGRRPAALPQATQLAMLLADLPPHLAERIIPPPNLRGRRLKKWVQKARTKLLAREERLRLKEAAREARVAKMAKDRAALAQQAKKRPLYYYLDVPATLDAHQVVVDLMRRPRKLEGEAEPPLEPWSPNHSPGKPKLVGNSIDRQILDALEAAQVDATSAFSSTTTVDSASHASKRKGRYFLGADQPAADLIERMARTGRMRVQITPDDKEPPILRWDDTGVWRFGLEIKSDSTSNRWSWRGVLRKGEHKADLAEPLVVLPGLVVFSGGKAGRLDDAGIFLWLARLRHEKEMTLSEAQQNSMLGKILADAKVPASELIESLELAEVDIQPTPCITMRTPRITWTSETMLSDLSFDYDGVRVPALPAGRVAVQTQERRLIRRDEAAEKGAFTVLEEMGFREVSDYRIEPGVRELPTKRVSTVSRDLVNRGWKVEADGAPIQPAGEFKLAVTSGIDWFELTGSVYFGDQAVSLPALLEASRRGDTLVTLSDGSKGVLPEEWLRKYGMLADLSGTTEGILRFGRAQIGLLDALVQSQPEITCDAGFESIRKSLRKFSGVASVDPPKGFQGELRNYQKLGLGWLLYLTTFGFGGILADDMGLGKTIQVLAFLLKRKRSRQVKKPSLIVVPRSLVFNWLNEARRFTPDLKVLDYTGPARHPLRESFAKYDLVVTTYGTMRSDIAELAGYEFEHLILDEAQAIKNADSQSAKAARLLKGRHRLAITGTPIENHLGELWSLFEFLNPGMLGSANVFRKFASPVTVNLRDDPSNEPKANLEDEETQLLLARSIRPFVLRRTKKQVMEDLPEKSELTLYCDMEPEQRKRYEELRQHFRRSLLEKGKGASHLEVLEALLRLRQAACHPGLISADHIEEPSAKLDMLMPHVSEVVEEGHKVLIFSQFTKFLAIVRDKLDQEGLAYEYLDGRTRNREAKVDRFQNDPDCPIFLISLKAGGLGLNLTAAEYVYLLDPWWNPAVEAQAIDRSHRIGQTQHVFAYRLICRDTVEQKITELQEKKKALADAILGGDKGSMGALTRDDLEFLLS